jgi:molybdate transport system substrate-binding protein
LRPIPRQIPVALALLGVLGCAEPPAPSPPPVPVTVLASASLEEYALEVAEAFEATANATVDVRTGATHELAAELSATRSADLFLAVGTDWMDRLEQQRVIAPESRWEAIGNRMVILGREEADYPAARYVDLATLGFRRLVVADPNREPAGVYARRWLQGVGSRGETVWQQLERRRETVGGVAEVLEAINSDVWTLGVVFASDIGQVPTGKVLFRSQDLGIRYSFALVERPERPREARQLLEYMQSADGLDLLRRNGFLVDR